MNAVISVDHQRSDFWLKAVDVLRGEGVNFNAECSSHAILKAYCLKIPKKEFREVFTGLNQMSFHFNHSLKTEHIEAMFHYGFTLEDLAQYDSVLYKRYEQYIVKIKLGDIC